MNGASLAIRASRRDAALRRLRTANRLLAGGAIGLTGLFAGLAAKAFPGHAHRARAGTATRHQASDASATRHRASAPSKSVVARPAHHSSPHRLTPPTTAPSSAASSSPTPAAPAPAPSTPAPVVSGGS